MSGNGVYQDLARYVQETVGERTKLAQWLEFRHRIIKKPRRLKAPTPRIKTVTVGFFQPKAIANKRK
jgi:hypothetical protein